MHRTTRTEADIDAEATEIVSLSLALHADPQDEAHLPALWQLASLIPSSRVHARVTATRAVGVSVQERLDLEMALATLAVDKIVQRRNDSWYLDISRFAAGASFSSWLRANAESALRSELRNVRKDLREQHPTGEVTETRAVDLPTASNAFVDEQGETVCDRAITLFKAGTTRSDAPDISYAAAAALSQGLGLRLPSRAALPTASRQRVAQLLATDATYAHRSARQLLAGDVETLDEDVVTLLDTVPDFEIEEWVEGGPRMSHAMLASVVEPTPPVKNATMRALKSAVRSLAQDKRGGPVTSRLIEAWGAWRTTITGSKYTGSTPTTKSEDQADQDTQAFYDALVAMRRHPAAPYLGSSIREVADWLEDAHIRVEHALANDLEIELTLPRRVTRTRVPMARAHLRAV